MTRKSPTKTKARQSDQRRELFRVVAIIQSAMDDAADESAAHHELLCHRVGCHPLNVARASEESRRVKTGALLP